MKKQFYFIVAAFIMLTICLGACAKRSMEKDAASSGKNDVSNVSGSSDIVAASSFVTESGADTVHSSHRENSKEENTLLSTQSSAPKGTTVISSSNQPLQSQAENVSSNTPSVTETNDAEITTELQSGFVNNDF